MNFKVFEFFKQPYGWRCLREGNEDSQEFEFKMSLETYGGNLRLGSVSWKGILNFIQFCAFFQRFAIFFMDERC